MIDILSYVGSKIGLLVDVENKWFVVGETDREYGWEAIKAINKEQAIIIFKEDIGEDKEFLEDLTAIHIPDWDGKELITSVDWATSKEGMTYSCVDCGEPTNVNDLGAKIIDNEVVCFDCCQERTNN